MSKIALDKSLVEDFHILLRRRRLAAPPKLAKRKVM